jgi:hypothetical protein
MADNVETQASVPATLPVGFKIATDDVAGVHFQKVKIDIGGDGLSVILDNANPLPVSIRNASLPVTGPLTNTELRAAAIPVSETVSSRIATLVRSSIVGTIAVNARNASIYNAGNANGTVLGAILKPGEAIDFDAGGQKDILGVIAYDATGTEFLVLRVG